MIFFDSGGRRITITGENLFTVQQPRLFGVYTDLNGVLKSTEKEVCQIVSTEIIFSIVAEEPDLVLICIYIR